MSKHKRDSSNSHGMYTVMGKRSKSRSKAERKDKAAPVFEEDHSPDGRISFKGVYYGDFGKLRKEIAEIVESVDENSSQEELRTAFKKFEKRIKGIGKWLNLNAPEVFEEQKHTDRDDPPERIYWHYGYRCGIADTMRLVQRVTGNPILHEDYEI